MYNLLIGHLKVRLTTVGREDITKYRNLTKLLMIMYFCLTLTSTVVALREVLVNTNKLTFLLEVMFEFILVQDNNPLLYDTSKRVQH